MFKWFSAAKTMFLLYIWKLPLFLVEADIPLHDCCCKTRTLWMEETTPCKEAFMLVRNDNQSSLQVECFPISLIVWLFFHLDRCCTKLVNDAMRNIKVCFYLLNFMQWPNISIRFNLYSLRPPNCAEIQLWSFLVVPLNNALRNLLLALWTMKQVTKI